jgi:hypothetical protein
MMFTVVAVPLSDYVSLFFLYYLKHELEQPSVLYIIKYDNECFE